MNVKNKKLLFLDCTALGADGIRRAKQMGIYTVAANFYPKEKQPGKQIADKSVDIDITDLKGIRDLIKREKIDGVFVGWTDSHLRYYHKICEESGLPCIGTESIFSVLTNKIEFKKLCLKYNLPVIPYYNIDLFDDNINYNTIEYPVFVKPIDGSGSKGAAACRNKVELVSHINSIRSREGKNGVLTEKLIEDAKEIFIQITIQDYVPSLSSSFTKQKVSQLNNFTPTPILHVFPSTTISLIQSLYWENISNMIKDLGIKNGVLLLQCFEKNGEYMFIESGFRMGGEQFYVFADKLNGINACDMMIRFAVTGTMGDNNLIKLDNPNFIKPCCNYYVPLKAGRIKVMDGIDDVKKMEGVLQVAQIFHQGKEITETSSLDAVCLRIHVMADTREDLAMLLEKISNTLDIKDENGSDMQLEKLTYLTAYNMIINS
jgi:biotin carboxylase